MERLDEQEGIRPPPGFGPQNSRTRLSFMDMTPFQDVSILKTDFIQRFSDLYLLHSKHSKTGHNGPRFVRTIDALSDAKKVFFCVTLESILLFTIWHAAWRGQEAASIYLV